jgi:sarcosine oxidase
VRSASSRPWTPRSSWAVGHHREHVLDRRGGERAAPILQRRAAARACSGDRRVGRERVGQGYDAIVIGVGAMGSAAIYHLASRGRRVLGLERYDIPTAMGSSHGITRLIRLAQYEDPTYVPFVRRAYDLWKELELRTGRRLMHETGTLNAGLPSSQVFQGALRSCVAHDLPYEVLTSAEIAARFSAMRFPPSVVGVYEREGGYLVPEECIVTHVEEAQRLGAEVHGRERVVEWNTTRAGVRVRTNRATYEAHELVISVGAWADQLVDLARGVVITERQVIGWFQPSRPEVFKPERMPTFVLEVEEGHYYGFPIHGIPGFKIGRYHHREERCSIDDLDREPHLEDEAVLRPVVERYFPDGAGPILSMAVCTFSLTPDGNFIIDRHPTRPGVTLAIGFGGHGFKFATAVGESVADLVTDGRTRLDLSLFRADRPALQGAATSAPLFGPG